MRGIEKTLRTWKRAIVVAGLATAGAAAFGATHNTASPAPKPELADRIVVTKSTHTMVLMSQGKVLKTYKVALGPGKGKKTQQGDHKTPEGVYVIDSRNSQSHFHLALHVSYPNADDLRQARAAGVAPGGDIMIHGLPDKYAWVGAAQHEYDWTEGCIALSDSEIEEVWKLVPVGTTIEIKP